MSLPAQYDLDVYQGDTFTRYIRLKRRDLTYIDLTGATPKAEIRTDEASSTVLATIAVTLDNQTTSPGGMTLLLTATQTTTLSSGKWDLQIRAADTTTTTYLRGLVTVYKEITRG